MKKNIFLLILVFSTSISLGQQSSVHLRFTIERKAVSLDSTFIVFFIMNRDTIYPIIKGNTFNVPNSVIKNYADFHFVYKDYNLVFYSVMFNYTAYKNRIWTINIDKRPFNKYDYYFVPKGSFWKIKWFYTLVRGNSQISQSVYRFPFSLFRSNK